MLSWQEVVGHQEAVRTVQTMLAAGRMPHALLFSGPEGIGKRLVANLVAAGILCRSASAQPCGVCQSCLLFGRKAHPDFTEVAPDGAVIKIDQIRLLKNKVALTPAVGITRVCLIDAAELMTVQAANSLLKLLEEPPTGLVFLLVAGTGKPLLPTILSRCRKLPFYPLPAATLEEALVRQGHAPAAAAAAARLSGGRMGKALALLKPDGLALRDMAVQLLVSIEQADPAAVWEQPAKLAALETKDSITVLEFLVYLLRDVLITAGRYGEQLVYNIDLGQELAGFAPAWPERRSMAAVAAVQTAIRALENNANSRLTLEELLINLQDWPKKGE